MADQQIAGTAGKVSSKDSIRNPSEDVNSYDKRRISDIFDKENGGKYNKLKRAEITRHGYVLLFLGEVL